MMNISGVHLSLDAVYSVVL